MIRTREQKRNEAAENLCRETRYQFSRADRMYLPAVMKYLNKWMRYAKKNKYTRP